MWGRWRDCEGEVRMRWRWEGGGEGDGEPLIRCLPGTQHSRSISKSQKDNPNGN